MKFFAAVVLLALFAVAFAAEKPAEPQKNEQASSAEAEDAPRDKRGLLLTYSAPVAPVAPLAYTSYAAAPIAYSSSYSLPYTAYRSYPYPYYSYYG